MKRVGNRRLIQQLLSLAGRNTPVTNNPVASSLLSCPRFPLYCGNSPETLPTSCSGAAIFDSTQLDKKKSNLLTLLKNSNVETLSCGPTYPFSRLPIYIRSYLAGTFQHGHEAALSQSFGVKAIPGAATAQGTRKLHDSGLHGRKPLEGSESKHSPSEKHDKEVEAQAPGVSVSSAWTDKEINWPNAISLARLVSGPYLAYLVMQGHFGAAFIGLGVAGISDWLDGYVARRQNIDSVLGSYLDPLADKALVSSVALAMTLKGLLPTYLLLLVIGRDVGLVGGAFYLRARQLNWKWSGWWHFFQVSDGGAVKMQPLFLSKVNTVAQLALVAAALGLPAAGVEDSYHVVPSLCNIVAATTIISGAQYAYLGIQRRL